MAVAITCGISYLLIVKMNLCTVTVMVLCLTWTLSATSDEVACDGKLYLSVD